MNTTRPDEPEAPEIRAVDQLRAWRLAGLATFVSRTEGRSSGVSRCDCASDGEVRQHYCGSRCGWWTMPASGEARWNTDVAELRRMIDEARRIVGLHRCGDQHGTGILDFLQPRWHLDEDAADARIFPTSSHPTRRGARPGGGGLQPMRRCARRNPTVEHRAVASLVNRGKASAVITQNIDGLHQASGRVASQPGDRVAWQNTTYAHCLDCAQRYEIEHIRVEFERTGEGAELRVVRRLRQDGDDFVRPVDAGCGDDPRAEEETPASDLFIAIEVRRWWSIRR